MRDGETVDKASLHIDGDVELDAFSPRALAADADVEPDATVGGAHARCIEGDGHASATESPDGRPEDPSDVFRGEALHSPVDHTVAR